MTQPEALRLLIEDLELNHEFCPKEVILQAAAELRRLHTENETLRTQHVEAHKCTSAIFGALTQISILTDLDGEVAEYDDVVQAVRRLHAVNQELLVALAPFVLANSSEEFVTLVVRSREITKARAAITKAEGLNKATGEVA